MALLESSLWHCVVERGRGGESRSQQDIYLYVFFTDLYSGKVSLKQRKSEERQVSQQFGASEDLWEFETPLVERSQP